MGVPAAQGPRPASPGTPTGDLRAAANDAEPLSQPATARVLLVEDDASIRRFVALALEELPIQLVSCGSLMAARQALCDGAWVLILLDLMLPDGHGTELLLDTQARNRAGQASWVIFSAGVNEAMRERLTDLGVARILRKPVPLSDLQGCVIEALRRAAPTHNDSLPQARPARPHAASTRKKDSASPQTAPADGSPLAEAAAVRNYFDGDTALFAQMKTGVAERFLRDCDDGDTALARDDAAALRRVAHSLKSALHMLGRPRAAELAATLEEAARVGERSLWPALWQSLRGCLMSNV